MLLAITWAPLNSMVALALMASSVASTSTLPPLRTIPSLPSMPSAPAVEVLTVTLPLLMMILPFEAMPLVEATYLCLPANPPNPPKSLSLVLSFSSERIAPKLGNPPPGNPPPKLGNPPPGKSPPKSGIGKPPRLVLSFPKGGNPPPKSGIWLKSGISPPKPGNPPKPKGFSPRLSPEVVTLSVRSSIVMSFLVLIPRQPSPVAMMLSVPLPDNSNLSFAQMTAALWFAVSLQAVIVSVFSVPLTASTSTFFLFRRSRGAPS